MIVGVRMLEGSPQRTQNRSRTRGRSNIGLDHLRYGDPSPFRVLLRARNHTWIDAQGELRHIRIVSTVHVGEIEMHEASNAEILGYAAQESRVIVTLDRDFPEILALMAGTRPSVLLIRRQRLRAPEIVALITSVWREHEPALDQGCVVKVSARGTRSRLLPLR